MSTSAVEVLSLNSVDYIIKNRPLQFEVKIQMKQKGRPTPDLSISFTSSSRNRSYSRQFNRNIYDKYDICDISNIPVHISCIVLHYAHQLNRFMQKSASQNSRVRVFFQNLSAIPAFFSNSSHLTQIYI